MNHDLLSVDQLLPAAPDTAWSETRLTAHEHIGFELGWDHARHRTQPPAPYAQQPSPLRHGLLAGAAAFGERALTPRPEVRRWLHLRLHAWLRGRSVELMQVTPAYLRRIAVRHCPITRVALVSDLTPDSAVSIDRVRNDAGYAAGNLAQLSSRANHAKGAYRYQDALRIASRFDERPLRETGGLGAAAWWRIAILCSFVEPLPHAEACRLPMRVLPPPRLYLLNPVQALQAAICSQLLRPGWAARSRAIEQLLPGPALRRAYQAFFHRLLPRVLEQATPGQRQARTPDDVQRLRWAIEDAWGDPAVLRRWIDFAQRLDAAACERLLGQIGARCLGPWRPAPLSDAQALEGWNLEHRGYVPHGTLMRRMPPLPAGETVRQASLAW